MIKTLDISEESEKVFEANFPIDVRRHSKIHWTPLFFVELALEWLDVDRNSKVLDIGSGAGKFCLLGAMLTDAQFYGVEKRKFLVEAADELKRKLKIENVEFLCSDILDVDFQSFTSFYFFNPFHEQIASGNWIDHEIGFSETKYHEYTKYVFDQLQNVPSGTRLVTYCSDDFTPPECYEAYNMTVNEKLILWVKK